MDLVWGAEVNLSTTHQATSQKEVVLQALWEGRGRTRKHQCCSPRGSREAEVTYNAALHLVRSPSVWEDKLPHSHEAGSKSKETEIKCKSGEGKSNILATQGRGGRLQKREGEPTWPGCDLHMAEHAANQSRRGDLFRKWEEAEVTCL